ATPCAWWPAAPILIHTPPAAKEQPIMFRMMPLYLSSCFRSVSFVWNHRVGFNFYQHLWGNESADCNQRCRRPDVAKHLAVRLAHFFPIGNVLDVVRVRTTLFM